MISLDSHWLLHCPVLLVIKLLCSWNNKRGEGIGRLFFFFFLLSFSLYQVLILFQHCIILANKFFFFFFFFFFFWCCIWQPYLKGAKQLIASFQETEMSIVDIVWRMKENLHFVYALILSLSFFFFFFFFFPPLPRKGGHCLLILLSVKVNMKNI